MRIHSAILDSNMNEVLFKFKHCDHTEALMKENMMPLYNTLEGCMERIKKVRFLIEKINSLNMNIHELKN